MKFYCYVCGKNQVFTATNSNTISCQKCNHIQRAKVMPRKPSGSLTGSKKFKKSQSVAEVTAAAINNAAQATISAGNHAVKATSAAANSLNNAAQSITNGINAVGNTVNTTRNAINNVTGAINNLTGNNGLSSYLSPDSVAHGVPIQQFDLAGAMGTNLFSSESNVPEMGIVDATKHRAKIARQSNALDVGIAKTQRDRKAVKLASELRLLQGDSIDYHTIGINNSTKAVKNQIADRDYHIESSRLEEKDELLTQQRIKTTGTQALTPLIAEQWQMKIRQQETANQSLAVDIEKGLADIDSKRIELEARLIEASEY